MHDVKLKSVQCVKDLDIKYASDLKFSQQYLDAANTASRKLSSTKRNFSLKNYFVTHSLCISLVRFHVEEWCSFNLPSMQSTLLN